ncbi:MAG: hypothetical protein EB101_06595 [Chitinophagia bacterium]|nr:hypothetical protein [Chitinophagia bacterium]
MPSFISKFSSKQSDWIRLRDLPGSQNGKWAKMSEDGKVGVYLVALDTDIQEIEKNNFLCEKNGYIGQSKDIVMRTSNIKATVNSKSNIVYHNAGLYIRNRLDKFALDRYVVKYFYVDDPERIIEFEQAFHAEMHTKFGFNFSWREASAGKDGKLEQMISSLSTLSDDEKIELHKVIRAEVKEIIFQRHLDEIDED